MKPLAAPRTCPACDLTPRRAARLAGGEWLLQCSRCLLGWWDWPAFDPATLYDESYFHGTQARKGYDNYVALEPGLRRTARARLRRLGRLLGGRIDGRRLLELGCGTGVFLAEARAAGWDAAGVEVSTYAADQARARGFEVATQPIEDLALPAAAYDCIALWDVLEHLRDPAGVLQTVGRALRPGGVLALSTGDVTSLCARLSGARWHLFNLPEHLFFFSPRALEALLRRAGCRVVDMSREWLWLPSSYLAERLRKTAGLPVDCATAAVRLADRLGLAVVPATLLDVLGVYALRPAT